MRFSKKIVVVMFATVFVFVAIMIATYWFKGGVPDSLIEQFFGFFGIEGGALAIIKVGEAFAEKLDKGKKEKPSKKTAKKGSKKE
nr:MAG TPA: hypothetical protein [Caudoviricetes sp.]